MSQWLVCRQQTTSQVRRHLFGGGAASAARDTVSSRRRSFSKSRPVITPKHSEHYNNADKYPDNLTARDLALDSFFARHRPLFMAGNNDKKNIKLGSNEPANEIPWHVSPSGTVLNEDMKNVPRDIVASLKPYTAQSVCEEKAREEIDESQKMVKVLTLQLKDLLSSPESIVSSSGSSDNWTLIDNSKLYDQLMEHSAILLSPDEVDASEMTEVVASPVSKSFVRPALQLTSVKRKRKLKMNKHKVRKRKKAQKSLRRKLNKD